MSSIIDSIRSVLGSPPSLIVDGVEYSGAIEYFIGAVVLCIVISSIFRFIGKVVSR